MTSDEFVIFSDDTLAVVNKPSGMAVHRSSECRDGDFLLQKSRNILRRHVYPVNRLDRAASGLVIMAFSPEACRDLQKQFTDKTITKEYLVLVRGHAEEHGVIDRGLTDKDSSERTVRDAVTRYELIQTFQNASLLSVQTETGRRHQIRRHFAGISHQLIGDTKYGKGRINQYYRDNFSLHRLFLHAHKLKFSHPISGDNLELTAPIPPELQSCLQKLEKA